ncbi:hypothetical protein QBC45DRAFT_334914, partial [Copromyces sp. CBS 386.78]
LGLLTLPIYKPWLPPLVTITMQFGPISSTPVCMLGNAEKTQQKAIPVQSLQPFLSHILCALDEL